MTAPTSIRLPPNCKVEIEFTAGVWTDVTADVYPDVAAPATSFGRASEFSQPSAAQFGVALLNTTGWYMPQNPASPYYPNVTRRKRIRYSYNPGVQRFRFFGYIKSIKPIFTGDAVPVVVINATDRMDQLSRVKMQSPLRQLIAADSPALWWPLDDAAGSTQAVQAPTVGKFPLGIAGTGAALTFGSNGPGVGDGTGVNFAATTATSGRYLAGQVSALKGAFTVAVWFNMASTPPSWVSGGTATAAVLGVSWPGLNNAAEISVGNGFVQWNDLSGAGGATPTYTPDGGWHLALLTRPAVGSAMHFWFDDVDTTGGFGATALPVGINYLTVGNSGLSYPPGSAFVGNAGQVTIFDGFELTAAQRTALFQAGVGFTGDTTAARIARYLGYAGLTASDWSLDAGQTTVGTYPQNGVDVLTACQDMATTEGGGAVFYTDPAGSVRFVNRRYRDNRTPALTLTAAGDLDPDVYQPSLDDDGYVTQVTASRAAQSGTLSTQTYSSGAADVFTGPGVTTYTISDQDALALAQYMVNAQSVAALRLPQVAVYLDKAAHDLWDQVGQLRIGDRVRVNFPTGVYPVLVVDFFLEGWAEQPDPASGGYRFAMDLSSANIPGPRWQWDVSTWDGGDVWAL
jgi:hypothetical protein